MKTCMANAVNLQSQVNIQPSAIPAVKVIVPPRYQDDREYLIQAEEVQEIPYWDGGKSRHLSKVACDDDSESSYTVHPHSHERTDEGKRKNLK